MMSVSARNAGTAKSYYAHLQTDAHRAGGEAEREDYYSKDAAGEWFGEGAEAMGLTGAVAVADFHALADGYHPETGEALVQNAGERDRVALYDCTFSAPKSVSNVWAVGDEETRATVERAHDEAVRQTLAEMQERFISTRRGQGGSEFEKVGMVAAMWRHGTSRELDEDLHTHATIMNVAARADGTWGTLDGRSLYEHQKIMGAAYRIHLDEKLREAGFATERDGESFRISDVPQSLEKASSTRREQILEAMAERGVSGAKAAQAAALDTRKAKDHNQDIDQLRERWKARAAEHGFDADKARGAGEPIPPAERRASVEFVQEIVTQNKAVFTEKDLEYAALVAAQGMGRGREDARELFHDTLAECVILRAPDGTTRYSTPELVQKERETMETAQAGRFKTDWTLTPETVAQARAKAEAAAGHALSDEQAKALEYLTTGRGQIQILVGDAGTGKSTTMNAVRQAYEDAGYTVIGVAPQGKQAADLGQSAGMESKTIHRLLSEIERGKTRLDERTVIVADEMGKTDSRLMHDLTQAADQSGAKVIMLGDHKQMQPVGPGAVFRHLADAEKGVGHVRLEEIHRQRDAGDREAVRSMSKGESAQALLHFIDKGQVSIEKNHRAAVKEIARKWVDAAQEVGKEKTLALASTNQRVSDINQAVRAALKNGGELQNGQTFEAVRELGLDPETKQMRTSTERTEYAPGDRALYAGTNDYASDLRRGDLGTVVGVDERGVAVKLDRDESVKLIDPEKQDLRHGYAITADRSQGATVERVVAYATSDSIHREMSYVMASRAKESTEWVTTEAQTKKIEDKTPPTERMLSWADDLAARGEAPALTDEQRASFAAVRDHLDRYADYQIGREGGSQTGLADEKLERFRDVVEAMSVSRQKESTLDYEAPAIDRDRERNDQMPEREHGNDRERATERDRDEAHERHQPTGWDEKAINAAAEIEARQADKASERMAVECLKDYQAAADLHRQGRHLERQAESEPDKDRAAELRDMARAAHGQAEGVRLHADHKRDCLPDEYRQVVKDAEREARRDEKQAAKQEDRAATHYERAAEHAARANDWKESIPSQALNAAEARLERWMAERAATAAKEGMSAGRQDRRDGIEDVRQMTKDREQERQAERQAAREASRERGREQQIER
ncbi:MobF family relaxase [Acidihalobacter prosperus]|uniref:Conjugative relaxase n=1 Tax=Acidihalobacter prosperus TaxID=160660 RepID=A0A1A6C6T4_9GAMM|nr:MobF family relaxase [Acidihalobacter prosperus]OBS10272.1 conjugative relaxase [Acidihalobacter prosperus]